MATSNDDMRTVEELNRMKNGLEREMDNLKNAFSAYYTALLNIGLDSKDFSEMHAQNIQKIEARLKTLNAAIEAGNAKNKPKADALYEMIRRDKDFDKLMREGTCNINDAIGRYNALLRNGSPTQIRDAKLAKDTLEKSREKVKEIARALSKDCVNAGGPHNISRPEDYNESEKWAAYTALGRIKLHPDFWDPTKPYDATRDYTDLTSRVPVPARAVVKPSVAGSQQAAPIVPLLEAQKAKGVGFTPSVVLRDENKQQDEIAQLLLKKIKSHPSFAKLRNSVSEEELTEELTHFCSAIIFSGGPLNVARLGSGEEPIKDALFAIVNTLDFQFQDCSIDESFTGPA